MQKGSTVLLRTTIVAGTILVLAICALLLPSLWRDIDNGFSDYAYVVYAIFIAMYLTTIPFFVGIFRAWSLLSLIDRGRAFSKFSVKLLRDISICAAIISGLYFITLPLFYIWAENDDAPGLVMIGIVLVGTSLAVSAFADLLKRLISEAVDLKSENQLTV